MAAVASDGSRPRSSWPRRTGGRSSSPSGPNRCSGCSRADSRPARRDRRACPSRATRCPCRGRDSVAPSIVAQRQRLERRHAALREHPQLPVRAEPLELAVGAELDASAGVADLPSRPWPTRTWLKSSSAAIGRRRDRASTTSRGVKVSSRWFSHTFVVLVPVVLTEEAAVARRSASACSRPCSWRRASARPCRRRAPAASAPRPCGRPAPWSR